MMENNEKSMEPTLVFGEDSIQGEIEILDDLADTVSEKFSLASLPEEEQAIVKNFVDKIDVLDTTAVLEYGAQAQQKISNTSDTMLQQTKNKDLGEVGNDLVKLVNEIEGFDPSEDKEFFSKLFHRGKSYMQQLTRTYEKAEVSIDTIVGNLNAHKAQLFKDMAMLDELYDANLAYFNELNLYIIAGEEKIKQIREMEIPEQQKIADTTQDEMEAQKLSDLVQATNRFEKKVHDLRLTRNISIQMAPQIRMIQNNDQVLAEKIQSSIINAIPLWKNQMVIALGLANAQSALEAQTKVTDMTNEMLVKNSEMLKQGTIDIAKEAEAGIISIETIQKTNENLITTIEEVLEIQKEGSKTRKEAEVELDRIEEELKQALIKANE